ncbi:uncharacterized protein BO80DRAFT_421519 [Aspergillus ibericus CBS 121593]|uniref:Uncharacterized protein n=1 Tax=Aspergillus ibericus CBS 121593 TaxID=1448316 RepID=A0A395HER5_9EURO|nr:hypothetical protein BO80DRAFT_421519 [Aspergillus ibericus CBS 121593]RAL05488.1 hypothetical protein BO80DRAFT_421519 [Aspergillus ibericus CBS 121593]
MGQLVVHWFVCNHLYPQWKTDYLPSGALPGQDVAPVAAIHAFPCPACVTSPTGFNQFRKMLLMTAGILSLILGIPVYDEEFIHSMVHFYARGDHLRWEQPPALGANYLPEDPHLRYMWKESYMNSTGFYKNRGVVGYAFDAITPLVTRLNYKDRASLNYSLVNHLPKSPYYYVSYEPLAVAAFDFNEFPHERKRRRAEASIQQAIAENQAPVTVQRVQTTQAIAEHLTPTTVQRAQITEAVQPFVRMDPSLAQSDPFVSNPASIPQAPNTQTVPAPVGQQPWLRKIPGTYKRQRVFGREPCPDKTPTPSAGDRTWSMVSNSPVRRYNPQDRALPCVNPSVTTMGNDTQNPPMISAANNAMRATGNENQESASAIDSYQFPVNADSLVTVTLPALPPTVPTYMPPNVLEDVIAGPSDSVLRNPWSLSPVEWSEDGPEVRSREESPSVVLFLDSEETALSEDPLPAPLADLPTEEPHLLQGLSATEREVEPNPYDDDDDFLLFEEFEWNLH